jgi:hypothetical protein
VSRKLPPLTLALTALLATAAPAASTPLESMLPEDVGFVMLVDDVPVFLETWPDSPIGKLWNDPQVKRFFGPMRESLEIDRWEESVEGEIGFSLSEVFEAFTGQAALVIQNVGALMEAEKSGAVAPVAVIARINPKKSEVVAALMNYDLEDDRENADEGVTFNDVEQEFQGETIHVRRTTREDKVDEDFGWAIVDGWAVAAEPKDYLQDVVAILKKGSNGSALDDSEAYRKLRGRTPQSDMLLYVNVESLVATLREKIEEEQAAAEEGADPMAISPDTALAAFGLDTLQAMYVSSSLAEAATRVDVGLMYRAEEGLVKLLAYEPGPVDLPGILPDDVLSAGAANFSFPSMWGSLKEILSQVSPMAAMMLQMRPPNPDGEPGVNPLDALFTSLGDRLITAEFAPEPTAPGEEPTLEEVETLVGIAIADRQGVEMAIDGFMTLLGGVELFDTHEYLGHQVHVMKSELMAEAGEDAKGFAYALTDEYLLLGIGSSAPVENLLARMAKPRRAIWQRPDVKAALATLPGKPSALAYYDVAAFVRQMFTALVTMQSVSEDEEAMVDPEAVPDPRSVSRHFGVAVGAYYKEGGTFHATFRLQHPK